MGLVASQARLLMLTAYKSDLEFGIQQICQNRINLARQTSAMYEKKMGNNGNSNAANGNSGNSGSIFKKMNGADWLSVAGQAAASVTTGGTSDMFAFGSAVAGMFGKSSSGSSSNNGSNSSSDDAALARLQSQDKELEMRQKTLETQHKAVQTEYESVQKVIDKNIEMSFKTFA